jgi:hypothetical protein
MILHARFYGVHAALIHSPCLTRSLMLDERLAQSSHCIIIITFSITLYLCLFFHKFSSLPRSDHVENNSFHTWCIKLSFHQVFIHPNRLRSSELCLFYSDAAICPKLILDLDALEPALDGASDFQLFLPWTCLTRSSKLMKTVTTVFEVWWRWCTGLQFLWVWFSPLNLCLMPWMVSET